VRDGVPVTALAQHIILGLLTGGHARPGPVVTLAATVTM